MVEVVGFLVDESGGPRRREFFEAVDVALGRRRRQLGAELL